MSFLLQTLQTKKEVDRVIKTTQDKLLVLRFGKGEHKSYLQLDDIAERMSFPSSPGPFSYQSCSLSSVQQQLMSLPVNITNYKTKYKALLDCEESVHVRVLQNKCNGVYNITFIKPEDIITDRPINEPDIKLYAQIEGLTMAQITYSIQASSHIILTTCTSPSLIMSGRLLKCNIETLTNKLYIGFDEQSTRTFNFLFFYHSNNLDHLPVCVKNVKVEFQVKKSYFNNLRKILEGLLEEVLNRIIPKVCDFKEIIKCSEIYKSTCNLDIDQFHSLKTILSPTCTAPVLITGPFGCGKTRLLVVATHCIMSKSIQSKNPGRVLLCCYQQQMAEIMMEQYFKISQFDGNCVIIRVTNQRYYKKPSKKHNLTDVVYTIDQFNGNFEQLYAHENHVIIVTTFVCAMRMSDAVPNDYFTHIFIDEGAQTKEPETLGPLLLANTNTRILIAGDILQAGPSLSVLGKEPLQYGLGQSLLQRLHSQYLELGGTALQYIVTLRTNYRCHPDLLELPSSLFYHKSKLIPAVKKTNSTFPLQFVCSSFSFNYPDNPESVDECLLILDKVKEYLSSPDYTVSDVCVVAASLNQVNLIRRTIYNPGDYSSLHGISICTSYDMQGQEFSLLFMSTIESLQATGIPHDTLKSLSQPAVFNTVITRAKSLVVVVGNPLVLMLSEGTMNKPMWIWREFIERCFTNNTFIIPPRLQADPIVEKELKCILKTRAFIDNKSMEKLVLTVSPVHVPSSGQVSHVSSIGPMSLPHTSSGPVYNQEYISGSATIASSISHSPTPQVQEQESEWPDICSYITKTKSVPSTHVTSSHEFAPSSPGMTVFSPLSPSLGTSKKRGKKKKSKNTTNKFEKTTTLVKSGSSQHKQNQLYQGKQSHHNVHTLFDAAMSAFVINETEQQSTRDVEETNKPSQPFSHEHLPYNEDLIKALLSSDNIKLEDLIEMCHDLNQKNRLTNRFEQSLSKVKQVQEVESNLVKVNGFLSKCFQKQNESMYQLLICDRDRLEDSDNFDTLFDYSHLNIKKYDEKTKPEWRIVSIDLENSSNYYSNLGNFIEVASKHAERDPSLTEINFCNFRALVFDYLPSTDESQNVNDRRMKRTCYMSQHGDSNVHFIDYELWKLVHECLERHSKDLIYKVMEKLPQPKPTCKEINSPLPSVSYPVINFDIKRSFKYGEQFTGWIGKSLTNPTPTSCLQLIEIGPSFQICLQHNRSPSLCFSESPLKQASKSKYSSIKEYIDLWSKVLIAEAANDGVQQTKTIYLFRNVVLKWPTIIQVNNCVDNVHHEPVKDVCVSFTIPVGKLDLLNYVNIKVGDLVCVRYNKVSDSGSLLTSVYHFVVTEEEGETFTRHTRSNSPSPVIIKMRSMNDKCWISNELKPYLNTAKCDMQVIGMPVSFNRVFKRLQKGLPVPNQSHGQRDIDTCKWSKTAIDISLGYTEISSSKVEKEEFLKGDRLVEFLKRDLFALELWETGGSLNDKQEEAIVLSIRNKFQLIQGPPGTGKTIVGAHLAYIFSKLNASINQPNEHCVLYCCPSNKAVDVVHKKLQGLNEKLGSNRLKIIRLYGRTHEQKDHPNPCYDISGRSHEEAEPEGRCLKEFKNDALHFKIRQEDDKIEKLRREFKELSENEIIPSITEQKRYNQLIKDTEQHVLSQHYDIILCTCNETCSRRLLVANMDRGGHRRIRYCIIDECGMAHEPETIAAASLSEHVTLIGDHKQLQPVIKYPQARKCGLSTSLFERYANHNRVLEDPVHPDKPNNENLLIQLNTQYRMHETICEGSSQLFYDGRLVTDKIVKKRCPLVEKYWIQDYHVMIYDVIDTKSDETLPYSSHYDIHSKYNIIEAECVLSVTHLLHIQHQVSYKSIAVLTPYAAQKELLKKMMSEDDNFKNNDLPKVATVVESQGDEYDIVILTTVRSLPLGEIKDKRLVQPDRRWMTENLGFLTDEHQINVAITRAKHGLIIIGNVTLLTYVDSWKGLFEMYKVTYSNLVPAPSYYRTRSNTQ